MRLTIPSNVIRPPVCHGRLLLPPNPSQSADPTHGIAALSQDPYGSAEREQLAIRYPLACGQLGPTPLDPMEGHCLAGVFLFVP